MKKLQEIKKSINKFFIIVILSQFLSSCVKQYENHGYSFEHHNIDVVKVNKSKKSDVIASFGNPSSESDFGVKIFYYISFKTETVAFFDPKIVEQRVISIEFDKKDVVSDILEYTINDLNNVAFSEHLTEIKGNAITPLEQILSNVGKFNKKQKQF